jgi:hypothetical protein
MPGGGKEEGGGERVKGVRGKGWASTDMVAQKTVHRLLRPKVLSEVRPQDVTH